jgi:hypothetical protein
MEENGRAASEFEMAWRRNGIREQRSSRGFLCFLAADLGDPN